MGHNLGLLHASLWSCGETTLPVPPATTCPRNEYGDSNDDMGSGVTLRQFHAHNKFRLGWLSADRVATVSANGATDIDLTSSEHVAARNPNGSVPTQLIMVPLPDGSSYAVERREPSGQFDQGQGLSGVWIRKIPVNNNSLRLDTTPGSWPLNDHGDGNLAADRTFTDAVNDVSISTMADAGPTARIRICRPKCFPTTFPVPVDPAVSATMVGTTVVVRGTDGDDAIQVQKFGREFVVRWPGQKKIALGAGCVWENVYAVCKGNSKTTVDVDLGVGNDSILVDGKFRSVLNGGPGDDTFVDIYAKSADVMRGGPGTDTVDYGWREGAAAKNVIATPGTGPDDGKRNEHDDIGADVELVVLHH